MAISRQDEWLHFKTVDGFLAPGFKFEDSDIASFSIVSNSAGGPNAKAYVEQLERLLKRMSTLGLEIARIEVDSSVVAALPLEDRVLDIAYPIRFGSVTDIVQLRREIGTAQIPIGQSPGARGGNRNRRIKIHLRSEGVGPEEFIDDGFVALDGREREEDELEKQILNRQVEGPVERLQLVRSRRGQGVFRENVLSREPRCRVTGVSDQRFLRASHIKPWRVSNDIERIDGNNGLMLAPHVDFLFDQGLISFTDTGEMLVSPQLESGILGKWGVPERINVGAFSEDQVVFLAYHRREVFRS